MCLCGLRAVWYACDGMLIFTLKYFYVGPDRTFVAACATSGSEGEGR
jgi:hypothetical protein